MPILAHLDYTKAAIADVLAQTVPVRLLLINQGADDGIRGELERIAEADDRIFLWSHQPPLPSLAATWNLALDYVWAVGGDCALVVNNDVRLRPDTIDLLRRVIFVEGDFVSCVGVTPEQFDPTEPLIMCDDPDAEHPTLSKGGPDFSCFLISRTCHTAYRFDEAFVPAFCEDLDYHRRMLLAGDGQRIFSVNVPYLHYGSATLKTVDDRQRAAINAAIQLGSRRHYHRKWGGEVNHETYLKPFGGGHSKPAEVFDGTATTPYLQHHQPDPVIDPRD